MNDVLKMREATANEFEIRTNSAKKLATLIEQGRLEEQTSRDYYISMAKTYLNLWDTSNIPRTKIN